jgi:hypothetical protein
MVAFVLATLVHLFVFFQGFSTLPLAMKAAGLPPTAFGLVAAVNGVEIVLVQPVALNGLRRRDRSRVMASAMMVVGLGYGLNTYAATTSEFAVAVFIWTSPLMSGLLRVRLSSFRILRPVAGGAATRT